MNCHWGNYSDYGEHLLFIGKELGMIGYEYAPSKEIGDSELAEIIKETKEKLIEAGYTDIPKLLLYLEPDL